jgi:hypothetical protein
VPGLPQTLHILRPFSQDGHVHFRSWAVRRSRSVGTMTVGSVGLLWPACHSLRRGGSLTRP